VLNNNAWAAIYTAKNATRNLFEATADGCNSTVRYDKNNAIQLLWDEGRNSQVANLPLHNFFITNLPISSSFLNLVSSTTITQCLKNKKNSLLVNSIYYTDTNLTPISISPLVSLALTVGNIFTVIFSAMVIVNVCYRFLNGYLENKFYLKRVLLRGFFFMLLTFVKNICFATISFFFFFF
jgi:hypothetical protein